MKNLLTSLADNVYFAYGFPVVGLVLILAGSWVSTWANW